MSLVCGHRYAYVNGHACGREATHRCRGCDRPTCAVHCRPWTLVEQERTRHDEGCPDESYTEITVYCDRCLDSYGPDEYCDPPEDDRDPAYERANRTWGETHGGEL